MVYAESEEFPFVFRRGDLIIGINPSDKKATASLSQMPQKIFGIGDANVDNASLIMQPQSFIVLK